MKNSVKKISNNLTEVVNRQKKIKIDVKEWREFTVAAIETVGETAGKYLTLAFVSDVKMRELNKAFRGKNSTTDVLSFPHETDFPGFSEADNLGDIVISLEQAARQASENNLEFATEIKQLILHGILHLCGFDHETDKGEMNERELELRAKLGI